jgi:hypothetical protein
MDSQKTDNLEDNLPMVNYIMLHRIYDMLTLIANDLAKDEDSRLKISRMVEYHKEGFLLGPSPAFRAEDKDE